ncbi:MAG: hypothetical protein EOM83_11155 [Clostridia bacterium]|nr:hypothetical protein [Clostridia bacterium]
MKRNILLISFLTGILFAIGCGGDDPDPTPDPPPLDGYNVKYRLSVFGDPDSVKIWYYVPGNTLIYVSPSRTPWEAQGNVFELLDSVGMYATIYPHANRTLNYEYEISVAKGSEYLKGSSGSLSIPVGDNPFPIQIQWADIVSQ